MNLVYLLIGGNIGDRIHNLSTAKELLQQNLGKIITESSVYQTAAWGKEDQPDFLNQVLLAETHLDPLKAMDKILSIENEMGRIRTEKNAPRIIDIDILFFNNQVIDLPGLTVPHPQIPFRRFTLIPLNEIAPGLQHPVLHHSMKQLLAKCPDELEVRLFSL